MAMKNSLFRKKVNINTAIMIVVGLTFLGIGFVRMYSTGPVEPVADKCAIPTNEVDIDWSKAECEYYYTHNEYVEHRLAGNDALFCFTIGAIALATSFIYRNHNLAKDW